jgi:hypothetical protein
VQAASVRDVQGRYRKAPLAASIVRLSPIVRLERCEAMNSRATPAGARTFVWRALREGKNRSQIDGMRKVSQISVMRSRKEAETTKRRGPRRHPEQAHDGCRTTPHDWPRTCDEPLSTTLPRSSESSFLETDGCLSKL